MYNAEAAPPEVRGSLVALQQLAICFGIMISFWINYGTHYIGGTGETQTDAAWLVPICLQLFPAMVLFIGIIFMPFSPRVSVSWFLILRLKFDQTFISGLSIMIAKKKPGRSSRAFEV